MCTFNGANYLAAQLDSIVHQTIQPFEIVIIDDGSTDDTLSIVQEFKEKYSDIKSFVNENNLGVIRNFSLAISKTCGEYVALADQDDIWASDHLEKLLSGIRGNAICVGDCAMIDEDGKETGDLYSALKRDYYIPEGSVAKAYRIIYNTNPYQGASMLIDRDWVESFLPIPDGVGYHDTYLASCASLTKGLSVIPDIITKYRIHVGQASTPWQMSVFEEIKRRHHFICYPGKRVIIDHLLRTIPSFNSEAADFMNEFKQILLLDSQGKRFETLRILNRHYREIFSCTSRRFFFLRSLHFLVSF